MPPRFASTVFARAAAPSRRIKFVVPASLRVPDQLRPSHTSDIPDLAPSLGVHVEGFLPVVPGQDPDSFLAAVDKRINYVDDAKLDDAFMALSRKNLRRLTGGRYWPKIAFTKELFDDHMSKFGPEKVARMEEALASLPDMTAQHYTDKSVFVKVEALLKRHDPTWAPRIIFQGTDQYNALAGPMFGVLMGRLKSCLGTYDHNGIKMETAYKMTTDEISDWLMPVRKPKFLESDFSGNDKTQVSSVLGLELFLMQLLGAPRWFLRLHRLSSKTRVQNREFGFRAEVTSMLATGVVDTTFRNTAWNATIFMCWAHKYPHSAKGRVIFLGDDMLFVASILPRKATLSYKRVSVRAHMVVKVSRSRFWHEVSFLSRHFVENDSGRVVMVPMLSRLLARFSTRANFNQEVSDDTYMASKSLSYAYETRHCPWLSTLLVSRSAYHVSLGGELRLDQMSYHSATVVNQKRLLVSALRNVDPEHCCGDWEYSRFLFRRYGLVLSDLEDDVDFIISTPFPQSFDGAAVLQLCRHDLLK